MKLSEAIIKNKRVIILFISTITLFLLLTFRLYYLQVYKNEEYTSLALKQRGKKIYTEPSRGTIFDKNLVALTNNEKTPTLIIPKELLYDSSIYSYIRDYASLDWAQIQDKKNSKDKLLSIPLKEKVALDRLKKNCFLVDMVERYNRQGVLSHVIGYINEADNSGETGIERTYDEFLKIEPRESFIVEYDRDRKLVLGGEYKVNNYIDPSDPAGVQLTIDYDMQYKVEEIMDENEVNGAIILGNVSSGEILALASRPNFNPKIGQGSIEVTPLQITNLLTTIANDGIDKKLSLIKGITNIDGRMIKEYTKEGEERKISAYHANILKEMLVEVVKTGTAKSMDLGLLGGAGGKTGSSEAVYNKRETLHGWFSGFYPEKNPQYVITILIENAPRGSGDTLPIFKEIIEKIR